MVPPLCGCFGGRRRQPSPSNGRVGKAVLSLDGDSSHKCQHAQLDNTEDMGQSATCFRAVLCSSEESSTANQAQVYSAVSAISGSPAFVQILDQAVRFAEEALSARSAPPIPVCHIAGAMSPGQLEAEVGGLSYIGQGATGLVYRASVTQLRDAGIDAILPGHLSVAVKFMICNTPHQLWQRVKEALLSKLVSHPNLVRTLAMDVTLVTPHTYCEWGDRHRASLDVAAVAMKLNPPCPDGSTTVANTATPAHSTPAPLKEQPLQSISANQVSCMDPHASASTISLPVGAEEPRPQTHPPPKRPARGHTLAQGTRPQNRVLHSMMVATKGGFPEPFIGSSAALRLSNPDSEAPCTVLQSDTWPVCCDSPASGGGSTTISKDTSALEPSWAKPGGGSCIRELDGTAEAILRMPSSSVVPEGSIPRGIKCNGSDGTGGGGSDESACILSVCGEGDMQSVVDPQVLHQQGVLLVVEGNDGAEEGDGDGGGTAAVGVLTMATRASNAAAAAMSEGNIAVARLGSKAMAGPPQSLDTNSKNVSATANAFTDPKDVGVSKTLGMQSDKDGAEAPPPPYGRSTQVNGATVVSPFLFKEIRLPRGLRESPICWRAAMEQSVGVGDVEPTVGNGGSGDGGDGQAAGEGGGGGDGGCRSGSQRAEPVPFPDILYHLEALPGRFLAKVIMEYCDSGTLLQRINAGDYVAHPDKGPLLMLSATRSLLWCLQEVAAGLAHLHSLNIIHGDLKPGNVLLTTQPGSPLGYVCKVSDFGLATALEASEQTITHENWGTVVYMAPESCAGRCRKASDIYSFGVLLWQMCTGERPYAGLQAGQVLLGVKMGTLKLQWPSWANKSLVKVGQACLRFEPKERPGFKGIRSALAKIAARLESKIAAVEAAGIQDGALLQYITSSPSPVAVGMAQTQVHEIASEGGALTITVSEAVGMDAEDEEAPMGVSRAAPGGC